MFGADGALRLGLSNLLRPKIGSESFARAQHSEIARLIPVLYIVIGIVTVSLSVSLYSSAPFWLSVGVPFLMMIPIGLRLRYWRRIRGTSHTLQIEIVRRDIQSTNVIGPVMALIFTVVGAALLSYSSEHHHEIAGIAIWILAMTSAFCLAATPVASIAILVCAAAPLTFSLLSDNSHVVQTMAGVVVLVSAQVIYMLIQNYRSFKEMVNSKAENQARREAAERAEQAASILANTDHLTGLPNRRRFEKLLIERSSGCNLATQGFYVGILDLDGFKPVNDVYGHSAGDEVLVEVAKRLTEQFGNLCEVARLGGDEFAFMAPFYTQAEALQFAAKLQSVLSQPYLVQPSRIVRIASSIGIAMQDEAQLDPLRLIAQADTALYHSKANGKAITTLFAPHMELATFERARIEQGLRKAISNAELDAHFQPIFELETNSLVGFEALARWTDSELGSISPAVFIPIAEQSGLIGPLSELILNKAATAAAGWPKHLYLSFNVSAEQLVRESSGLRILSILAECGLSPYRLEIEVTETAVMKDLQAARRTLENLKLAGARISLDDFGTGYSSLSQIRTLPLDKVKIDKSFIDDIVDDQKTSDLVATIVTMCSAMNITCTAEGIERQGQLDALKMANCHSGQGYLFAKPMPRIQAQQLTKSAASTPVPTRKAS